MRRAQVQMISDTPLRRMRPAATRVTLSDLPSVDAYEVTNQLYGSGSFSLGELAWCWESVSPTRIQEWIVLAAGDEQLHLALDGDVVALVERQVDWRDCSGQTQLIAWTAVHDSLIELLRCMFRRDWVPESIGDCDAPTHIESLEAGFCVYRADGLCVARGLARFHASHVADIATQLSDAKRRNSHIAEQTHAVLDVLIDEVALESDELSALTRGCIVRLDNRTLLTEKPRVVISAGRHRLIANIEAATATVVAMTGGNTGEQAMSNELSAITESTTPETEAWLGDTAAESEHRIETGALPVRLCFRAGSLTVPMRKLSQVGAGFVFELDKRLDDQVITIHANDTPIAVGELVALGDLIGVRITRMLPTP